MSEIYISKSESDTENFAYNLAKDNKIKYGDIIALYGIFRPGFARYKPHVFACEPI
jgi:hypothetical protein